MKPTGRPAVKTGADEVKKVEGIITAKPTESVRRIAQQADMYSGTAHKIIRKKLGYFPFKTQNVHQLKSEDSEKRKEFCRWIQSKSEEDIVSKIIFSDEAHFYSNGSVSNKQNYRHWSKTQPQLIKQKPLHPQRVTVWCGLSSY